MPPRDFFFVGYFKRMSRELALFLLAVGTAMVAGFAGLGLALGVAVNDPGDGDYAGPQQFTGMVQLLPYPVLRVRPDAANPEPRTLMLTANGKHGAQALAAAAGRGLVAARGTIIKRGDLDLLLLDDDGLQSIADGEPFIPAAPVPLGRWRLAGEICDGKCYAGAMRPGQGLAHKACANLCLIGGVPPVFVSSGQVEGRSFFLMAAADGGPQPERLRDLVALDLELDGRVLRLDNLLVLEVDLDRARPL